MILRRNYCITYVFLYHALLMRLTLADVEDLGLSSIAILLKHSVTFKLNVINKNNNIIFSNQSPLTLFYHHFFYKTNIILILH